MKYFLGIDTSTTSSKALLIDEKGQVIAVAIFAAHASNAETVMVGAGSGRVVGGCISEYQVCFGKSRHQRGKRRGCRFDRSNARAGIAR